MLLKANDLLAGDISESDQAICLHRVAIWCEWALVVPELAALATMM